MIGDTTIHWPVFMAVAILGVSLMGAMAWDPIHMRMRRKGDRLSNLGDLATEVYKSTRVADKEGWGFVNWGEWDVKLYSLREGVIKLEVSFPINPLTFPLSTQQIVVLQDWLRWFIPKAHMRDIKGVSDGHNDRRKEIGKDAE